METPKQLIPALRQLVHDLVVGMFDQLERDGRAGRVTAEELERVVRDYGRTLVDPPEESFATAEAYQVDEGAEWAVDMDLWTQEEGRSDLTLSVTAWVQGESVQVAIDDLRVL
jgi:hypothetical protein